MRTAPHRRARDPPTGARLAKHTFVGEKSDYCDITGGLPQREKF